MHPIKTPTWIKWLINPKYCLAVLKLKLRRQLRTSEGRRKLRWRVWRFIKKNTLVGSVILLTLQITNERKWRREAEHMQNMVEKENQFIRGVISMRNSDMREFPFPWWEKIYKGNSWRFLDLNPAYEEMYKYRKVDVLGRTNEEVFGEKVGIEYAEGDYLVWKNQQGCLIDFENHPDSLNLQKVIVIKYKRTSVLGDSISAGMTIPVQEMRNILKQLK